MLRVLVAVLAGMMGVGNAGLSDELAAAVQLVPLGEKTSVHKAPKAVGGGTRSRICVAIRNKDG